MNALPSGNYRFRHRIGPLGPATWRAAGRFDQWCRARHKQCTRKVGAQPFSGLKLMDFDQWTPIAASPAREPTDRTFDFIDNDANAAKIDDDLSL